MNIDPMFSFQIARGVLRALALFQAPAERVPLACTCFEIRKAGKRHELTLVATDGRRLVSYQTEISQEFLFGELPDTEMMLLDLTGCEKLPKSANMDCVTVEVFPAHVGFVSESICYTAKRAEKNGVNYPNWRAVIPSSKPAPGPSVSVNFSLLADFGKAAKVIDCGMTIHVATLGTGMPMTIQLEGDRQFFGLIMPMSGEAVCAVPDWMLTEKERAETITVERIEKPSA